MQFRLLVPITLMGIVLLSHGGQAAVTYIPYKVTETFPLEGPTRWDYLSYDQARRHLFLTHGDSVDVFDVGNKKVIGTLSNTHHVHGVGIDADDARGVSSNGADNTVTIFDLSTLSPQATVAVGKKPDAVIYDSFSKNIFIANGESKDITVLDPRLAKIDSTITLPGEPEFMVSDGRGRVFENIETTSQLVVIDTTTNKISAQYNLAPACEGPTGIAIDLKKQRLFIGCRNKVMDVIDASNGKSLAVLPIGAQCDATLFDQDRHLAISSNGEGTLTFVGEIGPDHYAVLQTLKTLPSARTMALDPQSHAIYLTAAQVEGYEAPTKERPYPRAKFVTDSFTLLKVTLSTEAAQSDVAPITPPKQGVIPMH